MSGPATEGNDITEDDPPALAVALADGAFGSVKLTGPDSTHYTRTHPKAETNQLFLLSLRCPRSSHRDVRQLTS